MCIQTETPHSIHTFDIGTSDHNTLLQPVLSCIYSMYVRMYTHHVRHNSTFICTYVRMYTHHVRHNSTFICTYIQHVHTPCEAQLHIHMYVRTVCTHTMNRTQPMLISESWSVTGHSSTSLLALERSSSAYLMAAWSLVT